MVDSLRVGTAVNAAIKLVEADERRPDWAFSIIENLTVDEELAFAEILKDIKSTYHNGRSTTYWNIFKKHLDYYE
jgi:hypothetical protein